MRKDIAEGTVGIWSDFGGEIARSYADRIEAAWKAERESGAEAAQICGEIGEMVGRESALSAPPRNCDVGTVAEQDERFYKYCYNHRSHEICCGKCPIFGEPCCELAWSQMPYEEGDAK